MHTELAPYQDHSVSRRERQEVALVQNTQVPARLAAARLNAASFVAHTGMVNAGILTSLEAELAKAHGPAMDVRATAIVAAYTSLVCTELLRLGLAE